jgi:hypothetical protein
MRQDNVRTQQKETVIEMKLHHDQTRRHNTERQGTWAAIGATNSITQSKTKHLGVRHKAVAKYQIFEEDLYQGIQKDYVVTTRDR